MADANVTSCDQCGASIYPEHIGAHKAGYWGGKLFCVHCFKKHQEEQVTISPEEVTGTTADPVSPAVNPATASNATPEVVVDENLEVSLSDDELDAPVQAAETGGQMPVAPAEAGEIDLTRFASPTTMPLATAGTDRTTYGGEHKYKRHLNRDNKGALRCRIFHAKLNDGALRFMEEQINEWIDQNPEIEIKHCTTQVGVFEGKSAEPHLIITVFF